MKMDIVYIKLEPKIQIPEEKVSVSDVAEIVCRNEAKKDQVKALCIHTFGIADRDVVTSLYIVNEKGVIKSAARNGNGFKEHIMSQSTDSYGYKVVKMRNKNKVCTLKVHRVVATAFLPNTLRALLTAKLPPHPAQALWP